MRSSALATAAASLTLTKKAFDVLVMDLRKVTSVADYFVICSADSEPQVRAIADAVEEGVQKKGVRPWHREAGSPNWVILDYVDVVVHIFQKAARAFYNLERLWGDAEITKVEDVPPPASPTSRKGKLSSPKAKAAARRPKAAPRRKPAGRKKPGGKPASRAAAPRKKPASR
ncbi:MAG: ribosome silencing factor [Bacteroidota bacterium]